MAAALLAMSPEELESVVERAVKRALESRDDTLTTREAARYAKVTTDTIRDWIRAGLPSVGRSGKRHVIRRSALDAWLSRPRGSGEVIDIEALAGKLASK